MIASCNRAQAHRKQEKSDNGECDAAKSSDENLKSVKSTTRFATGKKAILVLSLILCSANFGKVAKTSQSQIYDKVFTSKSREAIYVELTKSPGLELEDKGQGFEKPNLKDSPNNFLIRFFPLVVTEEIQKQVSVFISEFVKKVAGAVWSKLLKVYGIFKRSRRRKKKHKLRNRKK